MPRLRVNHRILCLSAGVLSLTAACTELTPEPPVADATSGTAYAFAQRGWVLDQSGPHSFDLDGDGDLDNQLGRLIDVLGSFGLAVNDASAAQFAAGDVRLAHALRADSLVDDGAVAWTLRSGPGAPPRFDGTDVLVLPSADAAATGRILAGVFEARATAARLLIPLFPGQPAVEVPLGEVVVRLDLRAGACRGAVGGAVDAVGLAGLIDVVAGEAVAHLDAHPGHPFTVTAIRFMDTDGDGRVSEAEVATLARALLNPDVDLDGDGAADHVALGLGFECVAAQAITAAALPQP